METKLLSQDEMFATYFEKYYPNKFIVIAFGNDYDEEDKRQSFYSFCSERGLENCLVEGLALFIFDDQNEAFEFHNKMCDEAKVAFYAQIWGSVSSLLDLSHKPLEDFQKNLPNYLKDKSLHSMICLSENT